MDNYFKALRGLFIYREPKNQSTFELLENNYEDSAPDPNSRQNGTNKKNDTSGSAVSKHLKDNINYIKSIFCIPKNKGIIIRHFNIAKETEACLVFIDGMVDNNIINQSILSPLMSIENFKEFIDKYPIDYIEKNVISVSNVERISNLNKAVQKILEGMSALFIHDCRECLLIGSKGYKKRNIEKPVTESVVRGAQEGFTEDLSTNITLLRRIIKNEKLLTEFLPLGKTAKTECAMVYIDGIANPKVVKEVKRRISSLNIDFILGDGMLEQLIEDNHLTPFPQILSTERPDRASSFIMEGQVVILSEGAPFALAVPVTFFHMLHTSEDSHLRWQQGTFLRFVRVFGMSVALFLPAVYAGLTLYHHEMIPTELLASITKARSMVPFPIVVEIIIMEASFELIREGGIRIPGVIGQTLGIIGALILGQAAVAAGLVSPILIIIVAVTGLGSFSIPNYSLAMSIRIIRFIFIISATIAGFYSLSAAIIVFLGLLCNIKSFGVPFLSPIAPKTKANPDIIIHQPLWRQQTRPDYINNPDRKSAAYNPRGWAENKPGGAKK